MYGVLHLALHHIRAALDSYNGLITAIATGFIAWFTLSLRRSTDKLWDAGERQIALARESADIAREAMIAGERAFVFATGLCTVLGTRPRHESLLLEIQTKLEK